MIPRKLSHNIQLLHDSQAVNLGKIQAFHLKEIQIVRLLVKQDLKGNDTE